MRDIIERERFTERHLDASERPKVRYEFYVTGNGEFPFDMLRYDSCWPASGDDAAILDASILERQQRRRSIRLRSYKAPTIERWSSFNWSVGTQNLA